MVAINQIFPLFSKTNNHTLFIKGVTAKVMFFYFGRIKINFFRVPNYPLYASGEPGIIQMTPH